MPHLITSLFAQLVLALLLDNVWVGFFAASFYYIGREVAQAEQRVIQNYYNNKRANAPWWCGFQIRAWTVKGFLDWFLPMLGTGFVVMFFSR